MNRVWSFILLGLGLASPLMAAELPKKIVGSLTYPESVCYGPNGALYISEMGEPGKDGDGKITMLKDGKTQTFADKLDDPKGLVYFKDHLYVTDKTKVLKIDASGRTSIYAPPEMFPKPPLFLNDLAIDSGAGIFLVSDSGDLKGKGGAVYRIDVRLNKIDTLADTNTIPELNTPNGVAFDGGDSILVADFGTGNLFRVRTSDRTAAKVAEGMDGADGLIWDNFGHLFVTSWKTGKIFGIPQPGVAPILMGEGLESAADCCLSSDGSQLLIPDMKAGTLTSLSTRIPGWEVDESPLKLEFKTAFPDLKWTGWDDGSEKGQVNALRPIVLTHANDGSNRIFVATQQGVIHVFKNDDKVTETKVFLDLSSRVRYNDKQNEEGFLGFALHPKFKDNGEIFVFYTDVKAKMANVLSRFRTKAGDKSVGDPDSEEELIRFEKPFWNHDGGCITFGPDGYLYVSHGDGGAAGDPHENGQKLSTLLGKVLRIDVNHKSDGKKYAIPKDNPFVSQKEVLPEIWAYGLRNVWRMSFDRKTGDLWGGEVGQNIFEEIVLIKKGGNYGWKLREAFHPHSSKGSDVSKDFIEPIWEYHHDVGRSITGGYVYRGKQIPSLNGAYIYADYVSTKVWALRYDAQKGRVTANQQIGDRHPAAMSFGEDEQGEIYLLSAAGNGKGIHRLTAASTK